MYNYKISYTTNKLVFIFFWQSLRAVSVNLQQTIKIVWQNQ